MLCSTQRSAKASKTEKLTDLGGRAFAYHVNAWPWWPNALVQSMRVPNFSCVCVSQTSAVHACPKFQLCMCVPAVHVCPKFQLSGRLKQCSKSAKKSIACVVLVLPSSPNALRVPLCICLCLLPVINVTEWVYHGCTMGVPWVCVLHPIHDTNPVHYVTSLMCTTPHTWHKPSA